MHNKFQDAKPVFGAYGGGDYGEDEADAEGGVAEGVRPLPYGLKQRRNNHLVLKEISLPVTKPVNPMDWRLLMLDKHSSHHITLFIFLYQQDRVKPLHLPSHSSHKSQALNRSVSRL